MATCNPQTQTGPGGRGRERAGLPAAGGVRAQRLRAAGSAASMGCVDESVGVCAPSPPHPPAPHVLFTCLSARRHIHFYSPCFQVYLHTSTKTHQISRDAHACARLYRPPLKKAQLSMQFWKSRKSSYWDSLSSQVRQYFGGGGVPLLKEHLSDFRSVFLTS